MYKILVAILNFKVPANFNAVIKLLLKTVYEVIVSKPSISISSEKPYVKVPFPRLNWLSKRPQLMDVEREHGNIYVPKWWVDLSLNSRVCNPWLLLFLRRQTSELLEKSWVKLSSIYLFGLKTRKFQGLPLSWNSSQFSNWAHKCLSSIFCQEYFMDLYLLAEMKTISLKITTVDMKRPPPDFRSNFEASQPPILIGVVLQIVSPISNSECTNFLTNIY